MFRPATFLSRILGTSLLILSARASQGDGVIPMGGRQRGATTFVSEEEISRATGLVAPETLMANSMVYKILPDVRCGKSLYSPDLHNLP